MMEGNYVQDYEKIDLRPSQTLLSVFVTLVNQFFLDEK